MYMICCKRHKLLSVKDLWCKELLVGVLAHTDAGPVCLKPLRSRMNKRTLSTLLLRSSVLAEEEKRNALSRKLPNNKCSARSEMNANAIDYRSMTTCMSLDISPFIYNISAQISDIMLRRLCLLLALHKPLLIRSDELSKSPCDCVGEGCRPVEGPRQSEYPFSVQGTSGRL